MTCTSVELASASIPPAMPRRRGQSSRYCAQPCAGTTTHGPGGALALLDAVALVRRRRGRVGGERAERAAPQRAASSDDQARRPHTILLNQSPESSAPAIRNTTAAPAAATVISRFFLSCTRRRAEVLVDLLQLARRCAPRRTCRRCRARSPGARRAPPGTWITFSAAAGDLLLDRRPAARASRARRSRSAARSCAPWRPRPAGRPAPVLPPSEMQQHRDRVRRARPARACRTRAARR